VKIESVQPLLGNVGSRNQLLVKVVTECGLVGWGESGLSFRERAVAEMVNSFALFLKGRDPRRIESLWQEMYRSQYFEGGRVITAAMSAIDIALHDVVAKKMQVPVYELMGGLQRDSVPVFGCCYQEADPNKFDALYEEISALMSQGWTTLRVIPAGFDDPQTFEPTESITKTAECLNELRAKVGNELKLGIDYHHRLSVAETASFCARLNPNTLDFLEEPIRDESPEAYEALRKMVNVPFAIGEEFASKWQAQPFLERGLTQYMRTDVCNIGGFTEAKKVAAMAETRYIDVMPHNPLGPVGTAATVHYSATVSNLALMETHQGPFSPFGWHDESIFPKQVKLEGAAYKMTDDIGLGVEVDEEAFAASVPADAEAPHLRKRDGSITNW